MSFLAAEDFDTIVAFGRLVGGRFDEIDANDDGPDGTNSELDVAVTRDGDYAIRAGVFGAGVVGDYSISVTRAR